ncbi:MAG: S8 family peptidase [Actinomycetota bacterium]|nr:S8 family peptidase [Actinomycetota bacterium]
MLSSLLLALCTSGATLACASPASGATYVPDQVIVKYAPGASPAARRLARRRGGVIRILGRVRGVDAQVVEVGRDARDAARQIGASTAVDYAEPDVIMRATSVPNDPRFDELYGIDNPNDADLDGPEGWDLAFGAGSFPTSPGVRVAIIDTGIDASHEDLSGRRVACAGVRRFGLVGGLPDPTIVDGRCDDDEDHGTHVAGTVAATANNGRGVAGVAPPARLAICKALDANGSGPVSGIANCIDWAVGENVKVISMSLGGADSTTMEAAVTRAWEDGEGTVVVAAAGNDGTSTVSYPAGYAEVISVAATDARDRHASFSNANADVEISAAGVDVLSTRRGGGYLALSGTSMAAPHVAGVAAVIAFRFPNLDAAGVRDRLTANADPLGPAGRDPAFGFGRVNLAEALE